MRIAIAFDRFGPYHVARLGGAAAAFDAVLGLEYYAESGVYAWDKVDRPCPFDRVTLFEGSRTEPPGLGVLRRAIAQALDRFNPDAVAVPGWSSREALVTLEWCLARRRPAILMSETQETDDARVGWREVIKGRCAKLFASAIVGGARHCAYLQKLGLSENLIFTGYDVVDNDHFARGSAGVRAAREEWRRRLALPQEYFVASARFVRQKNLYRLLRAFGSYRRDAGASGWDLVILGDGPLQGELQAAGLQLGLSDCVHWPGFQQYEALPAYYALARAFVHASAVEPWGLVVNEAMACGLPVLVSDRCGASELVCQGRNGFTFDPGDIDALARRLGEVSALAPVTLQAMGEESRRVVAHWGPDRFGAAMRQAADAALTLPRRDGTVMDRVLLEFLLRRSE